MDEIQWQAPEYEHYPKSIFWFWMTILIAVLLLIFSILQKNFLFGIFVIIAEVLILIWAGFNPKILNFKITNDGLYAGEHNFYEFNNISNFSLAPSIMPDLTIIKINFKNKFKFNTTILAPDSLIEDIKNIFAQKNIPEIEYEEHFIDSLQKILRF
ncbi:MAG: hypothetical protein ACPL3E_00940 [Minisyncoccia bacterium]